MERSPFFLALILLGVSAVAPLRAAADASAYPIRITLADGRVIQASAVRRAGNSLIATVPVDNGVRGDIGYAMSTITKLEMPEPPELEAARRLINSGKSREALPQLVGVVAFQAGLRQIPGNYWASAALLEIDALLDLKLDLKAQQMIDQLAAESTDEEIVQRAHVALATLWARGGQADKALPILDKAIDSSGDARTLARAWSSKGDLLLAQKDYDGALRAYLRVPIFYSTEETFLPGALLGSARAYEGLGDPAFARSTITKLIESYPNSPEAAAAKTDLARLDGENHVPSSD